MFLGCGVVLVVVRWCSECILCLSAACEPPALTLSSRIMPLYQKKKREKRNYQNRTKQPPALSRQLNQSKLCSDRNQILGGKERRSTSRPTHRYMAV
ncbi:hypothetical protein F5884DRAFT_296918 [Xylogone sp. PMI_703]|nr:hypothetical protein F5884DRAFT_296918 [Xylogone sp. PMI_703]